MFSRSIPPVPFGVSPAFQKPNGQWYVTVTIDNMNVVERLAEPSEIPVPDDPEAIKAEIAAIKKKARSK